MMEEKRGREVGGEEIGKRGLKQTEAVGEVRCRRKRKRAERRNKGRMCTKQRKAGEEDRGDSEAERGRQRQSYSYRLTGGGKQGEKKNKEKKRESSPIKADVPKGDESRQGKAYTGRREKKPEKGWLKQTEGAERERKKQK